LLGDTIAHQHLGSASPSFPEFFESFHVLTRPVYASKYFPAQGLFLAIGEDVNRYPAAGVCVAINFHPYVLSVNEVVMTNTSTSFFSHVQDQGDRQTLSRLINKHEVLRLRLLAPPGDLSYVEPDAERVELNAFREQFRLMESARAANEEQIARWTEWYERNKDVNKKLISENERLHLRITYLEQRLGKVLQDWKPESRLLYQT
jgi:hypothetical protein